MEASSFLPFSSLLASLLLLLLLLVLHHVLGGRYVVSSRKRMQLPPGSMGWPLVGETLRLFQQSPSIFFSDRKRRYGGVFKTHILGCPCVMVSSPEAIRSVLLAPADLLKPTFPPSKEKLIGPEALNFNHGSYHSTLKKLVRATFLPGSLRSAIPEIERMVLANLPSWENKIISTHVEMKKFAFDVAMLAAFGSCGDIEKESIKELYLRVHGGYNAMPFNLPGFPFHRAMKARKLIGELMMMDIIARRRHDKLEDGGLLGLLLETKNQQIRQLTDVQLVDNIFAVLFGAQDTTASVLTWTLKYLHDHRNILDLVVVRTYASSHASSNSEEPETVRRERKKGNGGGLRWEDMKSMNLTNRVRYIYHPPQVI
ncbi:hypothetical protein Taro_054014 [Colocasia esculenta]|uniref:Uncharacterized protein n=1 Tax=Colocasia esculenta TaxID=4460 RepID=A0A843XP83_COLES|nr:hypothetical protein [Colocasia esculenta]